MTRWRGKPRGRLTQAQQRIEWQRGTAKLADLAVDDDEPPHSPSVREWLGEEPLPPKAHRIRRTSDDKPVTRTEHQEQVAVIQWWARACHGYQIPEYALFAVPNGGARNVITASLLKAEGVRPGALDLILAYPTKTHHGLFVEMKRPGSTPSSVSDKQNAYLVYLQSVGYAAGWYTTADSAIDAIKAYLT